MITSRALLCKYQGQSLLLSLSFSLSFSLSWWPWIPGSQLQNCPLLNILCFCSSWLLRREPWKMDNELLNTDGNSEKNKQKIAEDPRSGKYCLLFLGMVWYPVRMQSSTIGRMPLSFPPLRAAFSLSRQLYALTEDLIVAASVAGISFFLLVG